MKSRLQVHWLDEWLLGRKLRLRKRGDGLERDCWGDFWEAVSGGAGKHKWGVEE